MKTTDLRFRIAQTQRDQQTALMNAILITVFAVVTASVGPQFLYQYALQNAALEQQMLILGNLPVVSYGIALIVFAVALIRNFFRGRTIRMYEQELQLLSYTLMDDCYCCADGSCECVCHGSMVMESSTAEETEAAPKASAAKKETATKSSSTKKSAAKKSTAKKSTTKKIYF